MPEQPRPALTDAPVGATHASPAPEEEPDILDGTEPASPVEALDYQGPSLAEADPLTMPWWLKEKTREQRGDREAERIPSEVYYAALGSFFSEGWIADVRLLVKSGKEATVYCCEAQPSTGYSFLAAKVYRPAGVRHNRNPRAAYDEAALRHSFERKVKVRTFNWDSRYREGRSIADSRLRRAYERRTRTGREVQNNTWARSEYETLQRLYAAGADVPRPLSQAGNSVLMEFLGDDGGPAPMLAPATIPRDQAHALFQRLIQNLAQWLDLGIVHADLSAYNLLYWQDRVVAVLLTVAVAVVAAGCSV